MPASLPVRLNALDRDLRGFSAKLRSIVSATLPGQLNPDLPAVDRAFQIAERLAARGTAIASAGGWDALPEEAAHAGTRLVTAATNAARTGAQALGTGPVWHTEATASLTPGSVRSAGIWLTAAGGRDLPDVRTVGPIPPPAARLVADRLENLPQRVIDQLDAQGRRSVLFSGKLTDVYGFRSLRGVHPRGWPDGSTWDSVPGVGGARGMASNPSRERKGAGHGTDSLALHEIGHVIDVALARPIETEISASDRWKRGPQREARRGGALDAYLTSYPEEWYAESVMRYARSPQSHAALARWYPETFEFHRRTLGAPQFSS